MWLYNIFTDPLAPKSNTIWIYSELSLSEKLFMNRITLNKKLEELRLRWIDVSFPYASDYRKIYNNLSAEAFAIVYPQLCEKYWKERKKEPEDILNNQKSLFDDLIDRITEAKKIHEEIQKNKKQ